MSENKPRLSRRNFLLSAGAGGVAAAAAVVSGRKPGEAAAPAASRRAGRGYQATAHTDNYYRTAKV